MRITILVLMVLVCLSGCGGEVADKGGPGPVQESASAQTPTDKQVPQDSTLQPLQGTQATPIAKQGAHQQANIEAAAVAYILAKDALQKKDFPLAVEGYGMAIKYDPEFAIAYAERGFAYAEIGSYDEALADFEQAIKIDPELATVPRNLSIAGYNAYKLHEFDDAIRLLKRAIEMHDAMPNKESIDKKWLATNYELLGTAYKEKKQDDKADDCFKKAQEINPVQLDRREIFLSVNLANMVLIHKKSGGKVSQLAVEERDRELQKAIEDASIFYGVPTSQIRSILRDKRYDSEVEGLMFELVPKLPQLGQDPSYFTNVVALVRSQARPTTEDQFDEATLKKLEDTVHARKQDAIAATKSVFKSASQMQREGRHRDAERLLRTGIRIPTAFFRSRQTGGQIQKEKVSECLEVAEAFFDLLSQTPVLDDTTRLPLRKMQLALPQPRVSGSSGGPEAREAIGLLGIVLEERPELLRDDPRVRAIREKLTGQEYLEMVLQEAMLIGK